MKMNERTRRVLSFLLALTMVLQYVPATAFAAEGDNLCPHHEVHNETCGYAPAAEGSECTHECGESCAEACVHTDHDETCGFVPPAEPKPCTYHCDECLGHDHGEPVDEPAPVGICNVAIA